MNIAKNKSVVIVVLFILIFIFTLTACDKQAVMQKYTSNTGRFSLMVPSIPKVKSTVVSNEGISVTVKTFIIDQTSIGYIVSYADYPSEIVNGNEPDAILTGARNGLLSKIDGELISEERMSYGEDPAIELHYTAQGDAGIGHSVLILSSSRLYQVGAIGAKDNFPSEAVKNYIDSFEIW